MIVVLISLLPLVLIPLFGGRKYLFGSGNWTVFGMVTALLVAACLGWLEIPLVLLVLAFGLGGILYKILKKSLLILLNLFNFSKDFLAFLPISMYNYFYT